MLKLFILFAFFFASTHSKCVVQGVCGKESDLVCKPHSVPTVPISKQVASFCTHFEEGSDGCCTTAQIDMLRKGLGDASYWFGR